MDEQSLGTSANASHGSSPSSPLKALGDESWEIIPPPSEASGNNNLSFSRKEELEKVEPSYVIDNSLSSNEPLQNFSSSWNDEDLSFSIREAKPSMVGAGLRNLGNSCFLNAILQCLTHTVLLVEGLFSCNHDMPCESGFHDFCVLCALRNHIELSLAYSGGILSPLKFVDNLSYISSSFQRYQQEDAHEFLQCFLDKLERCCLDSKTNKSLSYQDENLVKRVFGGRLISKLQCCNCGHRSDTFEPLIDLSLEIKNVESLQSALESFTKEEKIEDSETKFTCENCKEEVAVVKQLMLDQAPSVAAFHLKRFKNDGSYVEKIENHVDFPLELDLQSYTSTSGDNVELKYDLYAVVVHVGSTPIYGHYFSFIRSSPDTWHRLDDSKVTRVEEEYVLKQDAYILFYARRGTPWFLSLMKAQKRFSDPNISSTSPQSVLDNVGHVHDPSSVTDIGNFEANEFNDIYSESSSWFSSCARNEKVNHTKDPTAELPERPKDEMVGLDVSRSKDEMVGLNVSRSKDEMVVPNIARDGPLLNTNTTTSLGENNSTQTVNEVVEEDIFHPLTPPRSPSPDILSFETPGPSYRIPVNHLKSEDRSSRKKVVNKAPEDSEKKEAVRYLTKSVPSSRRSKLIDAMMGPTSKSLPNKKKRMGSPCKEAETTNNRRKSNHASVVRPVAAVLR
ncbi:hypothetical protein UlMin_001136 [Ulmus minor]